MCVRTHTHTLHVWYSDVSPGVEARHLEGPMNPDGLKLGIKKIAFIISRKRNNAVVSFGTLKVQSFMLTEVRDCDLLIVVTSSTFLKRKDI